MSKTYKSAGVDIDAADAFINAIKSDIQSTHGPQVLGGVGGFGAAFLLDVAKYKEPVLVSGTDGVGTKLKLAFELNRHDTIGIDLVAMSVNDTLTLGAKPLFFLDYYATSKLEVPVAKEVVRGIVAGCKQSQCALIGGETAELPGFYQPKEYDLAGFVVGVVERENLINNSKVSPDDVVIGLKSSGAHSNGYSLIRKIIDTHKLSLSDKLPGTNDSLGDALIAPTKIYVPTVLELLKQFPGSIHGMAHITGGGLTGNLVRVLSEKTAMEIDWNSWDRPPLMQWIHRAGEVETDEMRRTFNCGIGFALVVDASVADRMIKSIQALGDFGFKIGKIRPRSDAEIYFTGENF
ncbi:phosphoribosylformylglycinamidine cyclo-ligase [Bdellovibrionota bacterium]